MTCSIMTGAGFANVGFMGDLSMAWIGIAIIFFLNAFARKWIGEEIGYSFSFILGIVVGLIAYVILVTLTCEPKWGLLAGIIGSAVGGFGGGMFGLGGGDGE